MRATLRRHSFQAWRLEGGSVSPPPEMVGAVSLADPLDADFSESGAGWQMERGVVAYGWRVDTRKVPKTTLETELARRVAAHCKEKGIDEPPRYIRNALRGEVEGDLRRRMVPARKVAPVLWHPAEGWILLGDPSLLEEFRKAWKERLEPEPIPFGARLPLEWRESLGTLWTPTRLRRGIIPCDPPSNADDRLPTKQAIQDWLLWLALTGLWGEGETDDGGSWKVSGAVEIVSTTKKGGEVSAKISQCEVAAVPAALAEDGVVTGLRLAVTLADGRGEAQVSISIRDGSGLVIGWSFPEPDGEEKPDSLELAVWHALGDLRSCEMQLQIMLEAFASVRTDTDAWAQFVLRGREYLAQQLQSRIGFDPTLDAQVGGEGEGAGSVASEGEPMVVDVVIGGVR